MPPRARIATSGACRSRNGATARRRAGSTKGSRSRRSATCAHACCARVTGAAQPCMLQMVAVHSTERMSGGRRYRVARVEPYLFVILEGARPDAGGMRVALGGLQTLHIGSGQVRSLQAADGTAQRLEIP